MADSIPSLRRKLNEANERNRHLESQLGIVTERVVEVVKEVERRVEVPVYINNIRERVVEKIVYHDNPDHLETIRKLQEQLWQYTSVSDSLSNQDQDAPLLLSAPE